MKSKKFYLFLAVLLIGAMLLAACGGDNAENNANNNGANNAENNNGDNDANNDANEPEEEVEEEEMEAELGSMERPIKVLFVPSTNVDFMLASAEPIETALNEATGLYFEVSVPTSYAATIEEMCASPDDTIGFIPAMGYALGNQLCGVQPGLAASRFGWNVYWGQILVRRDSGITTLADLEGKTWGYGDTGSTSGYLVPKAMFDELGITPGDGVETGGHTASAQAVYNGDVDFATTYYSPPLLPEGSWALGDSPDIPAEFIEECAPNDEGKLYCGGYRVLDARANITEGSPDVIQQVGILEITFEIPNDTMSFSPDFPEDLKQVIIDAISAYVETEACEATLCNQENFYGWTAAGPIADENFDGIRVMMTQQGISLETIGE